MGIEDLRSALDALLLPRCVVCEEERELPVRGVVCRPCATRWPAELSAGFRLARGLRAEGAWPYRGTVRRLLVQAKEERNGAAWQVLRAAWPGHGPPAGFPLVAVPASRRRRRWHLAAEIVRELERRGSARAPVRLRRSAERPAQARMGGAARRRNLHGTFAARLAAGEHAPRAICVIDDVLTTGATIRESARALRALGVRDVRAWTLARVLGAAPGGGA